MLVRSGRPLSSSSTWAETPSASANAAIVQSIRSVRNTGAIAAPSATYDRFQAVYGTWSTVT